MKSAWEEAAQLKLPWAEYKIILYKLFTNWLANNTA